METERESPGAAATATGAGSVEAGAATALHNLPDPYGQIAIASPEPLELLGRIGDSPSIIR